MFLFEKPQPKRIKEGDVTLKVLVLQTQQGQREPERRRNQTKDWNESIIRHTSRVCLKREQQGGSWI